MRVLYEMCMNTGDGKTGGRTTRQLEALAEALADGPDQVCRSGSLLVAACENAGGPLAGAVMTAMRGIRQSEAAPALYRVLSRMG